GPNGFPAYVGKFRWTIEDPDGPASEWLLPTVTETTTQPFWKTKVKKGGVYRTKVEVLDKGGNVVAKGSLDQQPVAQDLTLMGNLVIAGGDYKDQKFDLSIGSFHEQVEKPGTFSIDLNTYDDKMWEAADLKAQAKTTLNDRAIASTLSALGVTPDAGIVIVKDDLNIILPSTVTVKVDVIDAAKKDVPGAEVTISANG